MGQLRCDDQLPCEGNKLRSRHLARLIIVLSCAASLQQNSGFMSRCGMGLNCG